MLHVQTKDNNVDRRRHLRRPTWQSAELFFGTQQSRHVCMVLDRSSSGVQIELGEAFDLPEKMIIQFSSEASQLVRRCWAAGTRAGMEFIGASIQADADTDNGFDEGALQQQQVVPGPGGLTDVATQVAALLQQIEAKLRDCLDIRLGENAVFFSEIGSRSGGSYRHKVTIIAPRAEAAALRLEVAINDMDLRSAPKRSTDTPKQIENEEHTQGAKYVGQPRELIRLA